MPVSQLASRLTPRGWLIAGGAAVGAILFIYIFLHMVSQPSYSTLVSGLDPSQTGKMTSTLSEHGVKYELQNNGTALAVQSNQTAEARVALAGAGLSATPNRTSPYLTNRIWAKAPSSSKSPISVRFKDSSRRRSTRVQGISGAQVELVLPSPQSQVFGETQGTSSAAVLLSGTTYLPPELGKGIAQLVSSSVPGLELSKVTITDGSGELLWPQASGNAGGSGTSVQETEQRYDQSTAASLDAMLAQTLGAGQGAGARVREHERQPDHPDTARPTPRPACLCIRVRTSRRSPATGASTGAATGTANIPAAAQGGRKVKLQARNNELHAGREQDRDPFDDRARAQSKASTYRSCSTTRFQPRRCRRSAKRSPMLRVSRPSAATRSRSARLLLPARRQRRQLHQQHARLRQVRPARDRLVRLLFFITRSLSAPRKRADRGARVAAPAGGADAALRPAPRGRAQAIARYGRRSAGRR